MTVANLITMMRIIFTPVFIIFLIQNDFFWALMIFLACAVSDGIDGTVARLFQQKSRLGAYLDPLADKMLLTSAYVVLAVIKSLPGWLAVMVLARDFLILLGVLIIWLNNVSFRGKPSILSKINTWAQFITVLFVLSQPYLSIQPIYYTVLFYVTAGLTIASGLHYIYSWFGLMGENGDGEKQKAETAKDDSGRDSAGEQKE